MVESAPMKKDDLCPCASGKTYGECCEPILSGARPAATAAEMMRARYSAYAVNNVDFLFESSGPEVRKDFDRDASAKWAAGAQWQGLEVLSADQGEANDDYGTVSFIARYSVNDQKCEHRETSTFRKIDGQWRFIDGQVDTGEPWRREQPKVGRNDPCPCGSGKKYKKCCGRDA